MNTQLQNTSTGNGKVKSAAQASSKSMYVEGVEVGQVFVASWGYEQTNIDFYQVVGVTAKSIKLRPIAKDKKYDSDFTVGGYATPIKDQFTGEVFTRRYNSAYQTVKVSDCSYAGIWGGRPESFTSYA